MLCRLGSQSLTRTSKCDDPTVTLVSFADLECKMGAGYGALDQEGCRVRGLEVPLAELLTAREKCPFGEHSIRSNYTPMTDFSILHTTLR